MTRTVHLDDLRHGTTLVKRGFARMQKGGVVMDVTNAEQAAIAEEAGAVAVMALERVPSDIRAQGGVARMSNPKVITEIIDAVTIPVMAKARIGHFVEAQVLQSLGVDMIDESEVLTPADPYYHIYKKDFTVPFVCGARDLGEAVRRIFEGVAMIRTKGEAGTGNVVEAVRHRRTIQRAIGALQSMGSNEIHHVARQYAASYHNLPGAVRAQQGIQESLAGKEILFADLTVDEVVKGLTEVLLEIKAKNRLPVVDFAAGGIATPADAALMMQLGNDGVFVGSGIFKSSDPAARAKAIVEATTHYDDPKVIAEVSKGLGDAMRGVSIDTIPANEQLANRGW
ncbi:MAG TPA: pyridoxal 5'-phosphate synthase lyase subunit PdxS [Candidatus Thermoplasmatota archaeon]|nr:pyridoxal 5'-phosphate synthase lyase subunit PdxS [Candidatus Thermoplasmatota archaeon]